MTMLPLASIVTSSGAPLFAVDVFTSSVFWVEIVVVARAGTAQRAVTATESIRRCLNKTNLSQ